MSVAGFLSAFFERHTFQRLMKYRVSEQFVKDEAHRAHGDPETGSEIRAAHLILKKAWSLTRGIARNLSLRPEAESALIRETAAMIGAFIPVAGVDGIPLEKAQGAVLRAEGYASADLTGGERITGRTLSEYRQCILAGQERKAFSRYVSHVKSAIAAEDARLEEELRAEVLQEPGLEAAARAAEEILRKA